MVNMKCGQCGKDCKAATMSVCRDCGILLCPDCGKRADGICPHCYGPLDRSN